jgi:hypothetical protein
MQNRLKIFKKLYQLIHGFKLSDEIQSVKCVKQLKIYKTWVPKIFIFQFSNFFVQFLLCQIIKRLFTNAKNANFSE